MGTAVCWAPCAVRQLQVSSVIAFAIGVAIVHATARFFGGQGSFDKLAYAFGAVAAPMSLITAQRRFSASSRLSGFVRSL
jgi:hypothetical protein